MMMMMLAAMSSMSKQIFVFFLLTQRKQAMMATSNPLPFLSLSLFANQKKDIQVLNCQRFQSVRHRRMKRL